MSKFAHVSGRLLNSPLMLRPEKIEMLVAALADRIGIVKLEAIDGTTLGALEMQRKAEEAITAPRRDRQGFYVSGDIAIIPASGTLVHKLGGVDPYSGMVGYDQIVTMASAAHKDDSINGVMLEVDSGGGEAAGAFEASRQLRSIAQSSGKPMFAFANEMMCSSAYAVGCSADMVMTTEMGIIGSIGVWMALVNQERALDMHGLDVTVIRAGKLKAKGIPIEELEPETVDKFQQSVDRTWDLFANLVSEHRGISVETIKGWEGDWFHADKALELDLIDAIGSPDAIFGLLREAAGQYRASRR